MNTSHETMARSILQENFITVDRRKKKTCMDEFNDCKQQTCSQLLPLCYFTPALPTEEPNRSIVSNNEFTDSQLFFGFCIRNCVGVSCSAVAFTFCVAGIALESKAFNDCRDGNILSAWVSDQASQRCCDCGTACCTTSATLICNSEPPSKKPAQWGACCGTLFGLPACLSAALAIKPVYAALSTM